MPGDVVRRQSGEDDLPGLRVFLDQLRFQAGAAEQSALQLCRVRLVEVEPAEDRSFVAATEIVQLRAQDAADTRVQVDRLRLPPLLVLAWGKAFVAPSLL